MLYTHCAGCGEPFGGRDVFLVDGRPLCAGCRTPVAERPLAARAELQRDRFAVRIAESTPQRLSPITAFLSDAAEWAKGRMWYVRAPLLLWFASIFWKLIRDPDRWFLIDGLNLGIHEMGHYALFWFGETMSVLGGSLLEVLAPIGAAVMFYRQRDYFAIAIASCWLGTALYDVGSYAADARARDLPLVSPTSADPEHDWYYLLGRAGLLQHDQTIGTLFHLLGGVALLAGLAFGTWLLLRMKAQHTDQPAL